PHLFAVFGTLNSFFPNAFTQLAGLPGTATAIPRGAPRERGGLTFFRVQVLGRAIDCGWYRRRVVILREVWAMWALALLVLVSLADEVDRQVQVQLRAIERKERDLAMILQLLDDPTRDHERLRRLAREMEELLDNNRRTLEETLKKK